jgi:hypothetical protein
MNNKIIILSILPILYFGCSNPSVEEKSFERLESQNFKCKLKGAETTQDYIFKYNPEWSEDRKEVHFMLQMKKFKLSECN